jgi:NAD(P)-dependent dehydrogenase (short-subunit alcohol dehydrogenase family)
MDVARKDEIDALAAKLKAVPIDVVINNAGVYSRAPNSQDFGQFDYSLFDTIMAVNVRGPLMVMEAFAGNVKASHQKKFVAISSTVGSLTQPFPGTAALFYRTSKAAVSLIQFNLQRLLPASCMPPIACERIKAPYPAAFGLSLPLDRLVLIWRLRAATRAKPPL